MPIIFQHKSYVYFIIPHSSYHQLLFNNNTNNNFSSFYFLPIPRNAPSFQNHSYKNLNKHFQIFISHQIILSSPHLWIFPPPETRGYAKFSPIIRLNICLLTHTLTHTHIPYNYRRYGAGLFGLCQGSQWKIALFASYTLVESRILTALEISTRLPCSRTVSTELFSKISRLSSASWLLGFRGFTRQRVRVHSVKAHPSPLLLASFSDLISASKSGWIWGFENTNRKQAVFLSIRRNFRLVHSANLFAKIIYSYFIFDVFLLLFFYIFRLARLDWLETNSMNIKVSRVYSIFGLNRFGNRRNEVL